MTASVWVIGRILDTTVRPAGSALIGNNDPAKKNGTIASAGSAPVNSSSVGMRLASVSDTPYMPTASSPATPTNQATPDADTSSSAPRSTAATSSTATCNAVI